MLLYKILKIIKLTIDNINYKVYNVREVNIKEMLKMNWLNTYPHRIYASVLLLNGQIKDYKIGENYWKSPYAVTIRGQVTIDELFKCTTEYTYWDVNNDEEHNKVFDVYARDWLEQFRK